MELVRELQKITSVLSLLYVEDDEQLRNQMQGIFSELFKTIDTAENGQVGLSLFNDYITETGSTYDIVITDINMPEMNGIELTQAIYETYPEQPIIVVSAHNESDYLLELLNLGINSFLIKPVKYNNLVNILYKVAKAIINERLVEKHYKEIDKLNEELSSKSLALEKSNDDLHSKNIALEKSMRIIEGMQHKHQLHKKMSLPNSISSRHTPKKNDEAKQPLLSNIENIISSIALGYPNKKIENSTLEALSHAVNAYADSLSKDDNYAILVVSLKKLSSTLNERPKCTSQQELEKIISILESFFFVYAKWEKEWKNIEKEDFKMFCESIENEINTLIDVWNCKI